MLPQAIVDHRAEILGLADRFGIADVRVFGSVARGAAHAGSDLDLLVRVRPGHRLLDLLGFEAAVEALLGRAVDVVSERGLPPAVARAIRDEAVPL